MRKLILAILVVLIAILSPRPATSSDQWHQDRDSNLWQLEEAILTRAKALSVKEEIALYLGERRSPRGAEPAGITKGARIRRVLHDPALATTYRAIRDEWFAGSLTNWNREASPLFSSLRGLVQCKVMIARNLHFRGRAPSPESIRVEYQRIQWLREKYAAMEIFGRRNVLFAASDNVTSSGDHMFARPPELRWLNNKAESLTLLREGERLEMSAAFRESMATLESLTFVFEGHGRPNGLKFVGGLSPREVAENLVARTSGDASQRTSNPRSVVILNTCQAHTFARRVLEVLRTVHPKLQLPVMIVPVELGDDIVKSVYNDGFLRRELRLAYSTNTHLGALLEGMSLLTSVYVPDEHNVLTQIA